MTLHDAALNWPQERSATWPKDLVDATVTSVNYVLDLHGCLNAPDLVLFMAGNQFRAIPDLIQAFHIWAADGPTEAKRIKKIFYVTLPPGLLIDAMVNGALGLANCWFSVSRSTLWPDVFMTSPAQQRRLHSGGFIDSYSIYARSRGVALLTRRGRKISHPKHLLDADIRVAISSPDREPASYESYAQALSGLIAIDAPRQILAKPNTVFSNWIHHREIPQLLVEDRADVAPVFAHLGSYLAETFSDRFLCIPLPSTGNHIDEYAIAQITSAPHRDAAAIWCDFMRSDLAAAIYSQHGFDPSSRDDRSSEIRLNT
jgi:hypothetical protein